MPSDDSKKIKLGPKVEGKPFYPVLYNIEDNTLKSWEDKKDVDTNGDWTLVPEEKTKSAGSDLVELPDDVCKDDGSRKKMIMIILVVLVLVGAYIYTQTDYLK